MLQCTDADVLSMGYHDIIVNVVCFVKCSLLWLFKNLSVGVEFKPKSYTMINKYEKFDAPSNCDC